uniref:Lysosome-associated membrane glycoprotein 5 n=1 Tax=Geospiza parvula TaxID=87175 RepID=A0A8C3MA32_GEOPR
MAGGTHTCTHLPLLSESPLFPPKIFRWGRGGLGGRPAEPRSLLQLITEQADIPLSRGAEMKGKCGTNESELELSWLDQAYTLKLSFLKVRARREPGRGRGGSAGSSPALSRQEGHNTSRGPEASWKLSRIQFTYDTSERTYFKDAVSPGKHTASSHRLSALVTPAGRSYECQAQQTISLVSSDHQKSVQLLLSEVRLQPFDIPADFVFSEGKEQAEARPASPRCWCCHSLWGCCNLLKEFGSHLFQDHLPLTAACYQCSLQSLQPIPCLCDPPKGFTNSAQQP